ncbi:DUF3015 domain-containing protein [Catenovulum maritimum]|uniref:DUF3015 domain-containing protein n=1 Tax=Catenovulum maritimum TaxID=1513271 RepID=A0A0J8GP67_9ALTE|nr:DUF3015 domain-containing protein [Catenovulum maritimum]KMT64562.1 hypothetical protein XM47_14005 [Catenovulum maritimum]
MKKLVLSVILTGASFGAFANGPAGCGLGTAVVFQNANEFHEHVLAATTNGTSGNQTFGMTSGTLGCESANGPLAKGLAMFLNENLEPLAVDVAKGEGETLAALADLMEIKAEDKALFNQTMKANFDKVFASESVDATFAYQAIVDVMNQDQVLVKYLG